MKTFNSEIFGEIAQPSDFGELIELVLQEDPEWGRVRMWRGQSDIRWPIHSAAYRRLATTKIALEEVSLRSYESDLLAQAEHHGYNLQDGRLLTDLELLARLQHHGSATRLIDFTRNVLVGLWFSVESQIKQTGVLIGIHSAYLSGHEGHADDRPYKDIMDDLHESAPNTWEPTIVSPRVAAQRSQFLFSKLSESKMGSLKIPNEDGASLFVAISPKLKEASRELLVEGFDIRTISLFPDIEGFSRANGHLNNRWEMDRW